MRAAPLVFRGSRPVAVAGGTIVAAGPDALELVGPRTEVVDLAGRTLLPGFRDGHLHPLTGGAELLGVGLAGARSVGEVVDRVREHAEAHSGVPWVVGAGYDPALLPNGIGDAVWLDAAVPDRPVALWALDRHTMWVNSEALRIAGIDASSPDPARGAIARRGDGTPIGTLLESAADHLAQVVIPPRTFDEKAEGLRRALRLMASTGVVWGQDAALPAGDLDVYLALQASGELTADIDVALRTDPARWQAQRTAFLDARERASTAEPGPVGRVRVRTVKLFADGVIESGTASLITPYVDDPCSCGIPNWSPEELKDGATAFTADGFQLHVHAIGDAAIRHTLDAVEACGAHRPVIAHTQLVDPADIARFARVGAVANFEPFWFQQDPVMVELTEPRLGPERSARQYPMRSIMATGADVSFGSDWPVSKIDPLAGIAVAATRRTPDGEPLGGWTPDQRVTVAEAIAAYTTGTAFQAGLTDVGRVEVGQPADLVVLGAEIGEVDPMDLHEVPVERTYLRGREVFSR